MQPAAWLHVGNRAADQALYIPQGVWTPLQWGVLLGKSDNWPDVWTPSMEIVFPFNGVLEVQVFDVDFGGKQGTVTEANPRGIISPDGDRQLAVRLDMDQNTIRAGDIKKAAQFSATASSLFWTHDAAVVGQKLHIMAKHTAGVTPIRVAGNDLWLKYWEV